MNVVVTVQHPGHVHFFKHVVPALRSQGHEVSVFARDKEITAELLDQFGIEHTVLAGKAGSLASLALRQATFEYRLWRAVRSLDPDVMTAIGGVGVAHVAWLVGARSVVFTDTEHASLINSLAWPLADVVCTPECFQTDIGPKQVRYPGYHELAYLHPDRFDPDPEVLEDVDVARDEKLVVLRLNGWDSIHDLGQGGFTDVLEVVERLEAAGGHVVISSEVDLPQTLARREPDIDPTKMHDLLYYADLFVGEGATMASESAVLGTPALYVNSLSLGYMEELDDQYGLVFAFSENRDQSAILEKAVELVNADDVGWERRRAALLAEKQDTTTIARQLIEAMGDPSDATEPSVTKLNSVEN